MEQTKTNYDEYLTKRARGRKIAMVAISIVALLFAAAVLTLSFVTVNNRPQFIENASDVQIFKTDNSNWNLRRDEGTSEYDEFYSLYNKSFNSTVLASIFSGNFGAYTITEVEKNNDGKDSLVTYNGATDIKEIAASKYYVKFSYDQPQSIMRKNGEFYRSGWNRDKVGNVNAENQNNVISFKTVLFALSDTNELADLNFYLIVDGYLSGSQKILTVSVRANTYAIYQGLGLEE